MNAYRSRYAELQKKGAEVIAISMDDRPTLARFKKELDAPFPFVPDPDGRIATLFGVREAGSRTADRKTFVVGEDRKVLAVEAGLFAIDPDEAVAACPLRRKTPPPTDVKKPQPPEKTPAGSPTK